MSEPQNELKEILDTLNELKRTKPKDIWDKLGVIGQLTSGVILVALGFFITWKLDAAQHEVSQRIADAQVSASEDIAKWQIASAQQLSEAQRNSSKEISDAQIKSGDSISAAQQTNAKAIADSQLAFQQIAERLNLETTNRNIASDYLAKLTGTSVANDRVTLMDAIDSTLNQDYALPLTLRLSRAVPVRSDICRGIQIDDERAREQAAVSIRAVDVLRRLKINSPGRLQKIIDRRQQPDAAIAEAILRDDSAIRFRLSSIDDSVEVFVNDKELNLTFQYGVDSPWIPIPSADIPATGFGVQFHVVNGAFGGSGVRIELQVGAEQAERVVLRHELTQRGIGFWVQFGISMDSQMKYHLNGDSLLIDPEPSAQQLPCPVNSSTRGNIASAIGRD